MQVAPEANHLRHPKRRRDLDKHEAHHLHLPPVLVCELGMLILALTERKVTCLSLSSGEQSAHATWAGTQDSSGPTQYVPLWCTQLEKSTSHMLDMYFCFPLDLIQ